MTTPQYDEPSFWMPRAYQMNIISSSTGMARKNSTTAQHGQRTQAWSESLPMPKKAPNTTAPMIAVKAILRVSSNAVDEQCIDVVGGDERLPEGVGELSRVVQLLDRVGEQEDEHDDVTML